MKKQYFLLLALGLLYSGALGQTPFVFHYQAIARDAQTYEPYRGKDLKVDIAILDKNKAVVYTESHEKKTSGLGVFTLAVGAGTNPSGTDLVDIAWANGPFSLKVDINPGGSLGETPLVYVPYAFYAHEATSLASGSVTSDDLDQMGATNGQVLQWNGTAWAPVTLPMPTYMGGAGIQVSGNTITNLNPNVPVSISPGTNTTVTGTYPNFTINAQGDNWGTGIVQHDNSLSGSGTTGSPLGLALNSVDSTFIKNRSVSASDLHPMGAANGQVLKWSAANNSWGPANDVAGTGADNWGTQTIITDATLAGTGIATSNLTIARQGATSGQVLKWNSSTNTWAPQDDIGGGQTTVTTAGAGLSIMGTATSGYTISNTGDTDATNDITNTTQAGGDVTGVFENLDIKPDAVGSAEIADGAIGSNEIADGSIGAAEIANGSIGNAKLAPGVSIPPSGPASGDLSGTYPDPTVARIQGQPVAATVPQQGQMLVFDNGMWKPMTLNLIPDIAIFEERYPTNECPNYADPNANTFRTRRLNTIHEASPYGSVTLLTPGTSTASIQFQPGRYLITASASVVSGGAHKLFLRADNEIKLTGTNELANSGQVQTSSSLLGIITVGTGGMTATLDQWFNNAAATCIFGTAANIPNAAEVYARIMIQKIQ